MTAALLAHQGGWDEILLVMVPIAIFAVLLVVANRRANSMGGGGPAHDRANGDAGDRPGDASGRDRAQGGGTAAR
ncbi:MAG TPA: hypothetical protein VFZ77_21170 [Acidimicrobiales bacterium]